MKDYERYVVWPEYFNSELKRNQGRRVPLSAATKAPRLEELTEACRRLNLQPTAQRAAHPRIGKPDSGYVSVKKSKPKQSLIMRIAKELTVVRGKSAARQAQPQQSQKR